MMFVFGFTADFADALHGVFHFSRFGVKCTNTTLHETVKFPCFGLQQRSPISLMCVAFRPCVLHHQMPLWGGFIPARCNRAFVGCAISCPTAMLKKPFGCRHCSRTPS